MIIATHTNELNEALLRLPSSCKTGFVPTMGALHAGHTSLINKAKDENDIVIASIFVNPKQFNDPNDLRNYPRTPESDFTLLKEQDCDIVFYPETSAIYNGTAYEVPDFGFMESVMEGVSRPGHFRGMAEVVGRLLEFINPVNAYFGEKDFQQLAIIKKLVTIKKYPTQIIGCPTIRESDGLAMSSRNILLTSSERESAPVIYRSLKKVADLFQNGRGAELQQTFVNDVESFGNLKVEYLYVGDSETLEEAKKYEAGRRYRIFTAVKTSKVRLIDNIASGY